MEKALYFLSYDLVKVKDYQKLYDELSRFGAKRVLESVWCLGTRGTVLLSSETTL